MVYIEHMTTLNITSRLGLSSLYPLTLFKNLHAKLVTGPSIATVEVLTLFCVSISHALVTAVAALDGTQDTVHVRRTAPFLVSKDLDSKFLLACLNLAHVGEHALILEGTGKLCCHGSVGV